MSHPYNFYQGSGLNFYPSGFSGIYIPTGMLDTPMYFHWRIDQELFEQRPSFSINLSYSLESGPKFNTNDYRVVFSGELLGLRSGISDYRVSFSGQKNNSNLNTSLINVNISGEQKGNLDTHNLSLNLTGTHKNHTIDNGLLDLFLSGAFTPAVIDYSNFNCSLSGNFIKSKKDTSLLGITFTGLEWDVYHPKINIILDTEQADINVSLVRIVWSRAGG